MGETIFDVIYPLTIVMDRYSGVYSGGLFTAWNLEPCDVPIDILSDDVTCMDFWYGVNGDVLSGVIRDDIICGVGNTPDEAAANLYARLRRTNNASQEN